jgi:hypothetical protein
MHHTRTHQWHQLMQPLRPLPRQHPQFPIHTPPAENPGKVLGIVGIVLNALALLLLLILIPVGLVATVRVQERAKDSSAETYANTVVTKVEAYGAEQAMFARDTADFANVQTAALSNPEFTVIDSQPTK